MATADFAEALQQSAFGETFPPEVIASLADNARWKTCSAGNVLFREGERHESFYVVHRGNVRLDMCLPARGCTPLMTVGPGEIVAWSGLVGDGRMTATATTVDDVQLIELSAADLLRRCEADAVFGYRLMHRLATALAKRLLATRLQLIDLFFADAEDRGRNLG